MDCSRNISTELTLYFLEQFYVLVDTCTEIIKDPIGDLLFFHFRFPDFFLTTAHVQFDSFQQFIFTGYHCMLAILKACVH